MIQDTDFASGFWFDQKIHSDRFSCLKGLVSSSVETISKEHVLLMPSGIDAIGKYFQWYDNII